jgi:hypothetical protein
MGLPASEIEQALVRAIQTRSIVRLGYDRIYRGAVSTLHEVAPIDIRFGESPRTATTRYLLAYCFDQERPEMHLLSNCRAVSTTDRQFSPHDVRARWPDRWPMPDQWFVQREWSFV